jgi:hypothetical protein
LRWWVEKKFSSWSKTFFATDRIIWIWGIRCSFLPNKKILNARESCKTNLQRQNFSTYVTWYYMSQK